MFKQLNRDMNMIIAKAEKRLRKNILSQYIFQFDMHDKYFLIRQIGKSFPELPVNLISKTVSRCIGMIKSPITKNDFIRIFLDQLFLIVDEERGA